MCVCGLLSSTYLVSTKTNFLATARAVEPLGNYIQNQNQNLNPVLENWVQTH